MNQEKDQQIQKAFDDLVNEPAPLRLLEPALMELRKIKKAERRSFWGGLVAVSVVPITIIAVIVVSLNSFSSNQAHATSQSTALQQTTLNQTAPTDNIIYYHKAETTVASLSASEFNHFVTTYSLPALAAIGDADYQPTFFIHRLKTNNEPVLLTLKTRANSNQGTHDIMVAVELSNAAYQEYAMFNDYPQMNINNQVVHYDSFYVDGEFNQQATTKLNNNQYYLLVLSPTDNQIMTYLNQLINLARTN